MVWRVLIITVSSTWLVSSLQSYYQPPWESSIWGYFSPPQSHQTEMDTMVDLTNNLGVAILQDHSYSKGNFAFSPYGLASVLVVLYEGARGESAIQIQRAFRFPSDKDVIRVGFRDIHRHLRSYFSHEGYLSGISLNKDQSSLKPEFKRILRFYGYDVELNETLVDGQPLESSSIAGNEATTVLPTTSPVTKVPDVKTTTTNDQTTTQENAEQTSDSTIPSTTPPVTKIPDLESTETTVAQTTTELNSEETNDSTIPPTTPSTPPDTEKATEGKDQPTTQQNSELTKESTIPPTTISEEQTTIPPETTIKIELMEYTTKPGQETTEEAHLTTAVPTTEDPPTTTITDNKTKPVTIANDEVQIILTVDDCRKRAAKNGKEDDCLTENGVGKADERNNQEENEKIAKLDNKMLIPQPGDLKSITASTQTPSPAYHMMKNPEIVVEAKQEIKMSKKLTQEETTDNKKFASEKVFNWLEQKPSKSKSRKLRTITDYLKWPETAELTLQLQNGMYDTHLSRNAQMYQNLPRMFFLVDGAIETPVPMMTYTYIFPYAYVPNLHAKALEFPLDDTRYKLLILLPVERRGLRQLIHDLMGYPLRDVLDALKPVRVKTTIPTFMVEGFVILTSSLQKLGIWDVFDPRKANLSGMSLDPELYVRNVEQSVTVVIRNYVEILDIQTRTMAARYIDYNFEATHPFVYFVLDSATNVALMAGQMLDPLNSRIY